MYLPDSNVEEIKILMDVNEYNNYLKAVDIICLNCKKDTLNNEGICEECSVRKFCQMIEQRLV